MKIGDSVKIKECHSMPQVVGRVAKIVADKEEAEKHGETLGKYDFIVVVQPFKMDTPMGVAMAIIPPMPFRVDELEQVDEQGNPIATEAIEGKADKEGGVNIPQGTKGIPEAFLKGLEDKPQEPPTIAG